MQLQGAQQQRHELVPYLQDTPSAGERDDAVGAGAAVQLCSWLLEVSDAFQDSLMKIHSKSINHQRILVGGDFAQLNSFARRLCPDTGAPPPNAARLTAETTGSQGSPHFRT